MLLFKEKHIEPILNGTKVETRRIWKRQRVRVGSIHQCRTQMLNKDSCFAKVRILDVHKEQLGDITNAGAIREGYPDRETYIDTFISINQKKVISNPTDIYFQSVYAITFEVVKDGQ